MNRLNDPYDKWFDRKQMVRDVHAMRELAEDQGLSVRGQPGPFEMTAELEREAEEHAVILRRQADDARETLVAVERLHEVEAENLLVAGVAALSAERSREHLSYACDALDDLGDGIAEANEHLGDIVRGIDRLHVTVGQAARFIGQQIGEVGRRQVAAQVEIARKQEESSERRHRELIAELKRELGNRADEKFLQATIQFRTRHNNDALREIRETFRHDSTHVGAWILYGRLCIRRAQPGHARACYRRAIGYAEQKRDWNGCIDAAVRLSHLERMVGNYVAACETMERTLKNVNRKSPLYDAVSYEEKKARWAWTWNASGRNVPDSVVLGMRDELSVLLKTSPDLRADIARSPLWKKMPAPG